MKTLAMILLLCAAGASSIGCRTHHLGPDFGARYREAFAAQTEKPAEGPAPLDADDAQNALNQHRGGDSAAPKLPAAPVVLPIR